MSDVVNIRLAEQVQLDRARLGALCAQLGDRGGGSVIARAMEELAVRLAQCESYRRAADTGLLRKQARSLIAISDQLGMHRLAQVAHDVTVCIDARDDVALAATVSRLMRTGERSLSAMWSVEDIGF